MKTNCKTCESSGFLIKGEVYSITGKFEIENRAILSYKCKAGHYWTKTASNGEIK